MPEFSLLINVAIALVVAFFGGLLARRLGLPTIVGYLLAGIIIGPFTPGFVGDTETIRQLAELGVIFLMFGVGLQFSLSDLWVVRQIAIPGGLGRLLLVIALGYALSRLWGWESVPGLVLGVAIAGASTIVLIRGLVDHSLLNTRHGQAAVGWSVAEDLATVFILVLLPTLAQPGAGFDWQTMSATLLKALAFAVLSALLGTRMIPWLLHAIARTRSRELFILAVLAVSLGTALAAAELFGVSLALGAFVAGVVVSESPLSHQVAADVLPFREAFAVLFFVSIGMLVNPAYLVRNAGPLLLLLLLAVLGKALLTFVLGGLLRWPAYTTLVLAAGTSQISEFSFIVGQASLSLGLIDGEAYSLILAAALLTIAINPLLFRLIGPAERALRRLGIWERFASPGVVPTPVAQPLANHIVVVGYGRVGHHIVDVCQSLHIPCLVIESDVERVAELNTAGTATLYGDAANSEVLTQAGLERARALVVTMPQEVANEMVVTTGHDLAPSLPIIARAATTEGVKRLANSGARHVIHPEMEGGLEIVRHTLLELGFPLGDVSRYTDSVRLDHYDLQINSEAEHRQLRSLLDALGNIEVSWQVIAEGSPVVGQTLAAANLRARCGASVVALIRNGQLIANPKSQTVFEAGDRIGLIGEAEQVAAAAELLGEQRPAGTPTESTEGRERDILAAT